MFGRSDGPFSVPAALRVLSLQRREASGAVSLACLRRWGAQVVDGYGRDTGLGPFSDPRR